MEEAVHLTVLSGRLADGEAVTVRGHLLVEHGTASLCSELLESFPPQCGGDRLEVVNLPDDVEAGLTAGGDARWSDRPVTLSGDIRDGRLVVG